jgi:hypothetical protein
MKKRTILLLIFLIASVALLTWWLLRPGKSSQPLSLSKSGNLPAPAQPAPPTAVHGLATAPATQATPLSSQPRHLFKSTNYPPQTAEEKAQWDWWRTMRKADPSFEWKMPIEFYGKVIDQFGAGVEAATVDLGWTTVIGPSPDPKKTILSGPDGRFSIAGIQGRCLSVSVRKEGYVDIGTNSIKSFEYAEFFDNHFYIPDPNGPVVFKLQKLMGAEPIYKFLPYGTITVGGAPLVLDVETGKISKQGDLACSVTIGPGRGDFDAADFTVMLEGLNGAGFRQSDEEFLFNAPESGYQNTLVLALKADDPNYRASQTLRFYVKTCSGKYAAAEVEVTLYGKLKSAGFSAIIYYNPSGSRNLEFDQNKWINR